MKILILYHDLIKKLSQLFVKWIKIRNFQSIFHSTQFPYVDFHSNPHRNIETRCWAELDIGLPSLSLLKNRRLYVIVLEVNR